MHVSLANVQSTSYLSDMSKTLPDTNHNVRIEAIEVLSDSWYILRKVRFEILDRHGRWSKREREAYDRGNGATVLLVDWSRRTVLLTRQFRIPAYLNGHADGMLLETPAGLLDNDDAETAIRREAEEETGCKIRSITRLFDLYMSPGSVTERVAYYVAEYAPSDLTGTGGGVEEEGEDIEVVELDLDEAFAAITDGRVNDGKTVLLLQWAQLNDPQRQGRSACC